MAERERDEKLIIERRGDVYHVTLQHFGGFPRGHAFGSHVGLEEIEAPLEDWGVDTLVFVAQPENPAFAGRLGRLHL